MQITVAGIFNILNGLCLIKWLIFHLSNSEIKLLTAILVLLNEKRNSISFIACQLWLAVSSLWVDCAPMLSFPVQHPEINCGLKLTLFIRVVIQKGNAVIAYDFSLHEWSFALISTSVLLKVKHFTLFPSWSLQTCCWLEIATFTVNAPECEVTQEDFLSSLWSVVLKKIVSCRDELWLIK